MAKQKQSLPDGKTQHQTGVQTTNHDNQQSLTLSNYWNTETKIQSIEDCEIASQNSVAIMHIPVRDELLSYLISDFCDFAGAEMSISSQSQLIDLIIERYGLYKPEYFVLFFKELKTKGNWYGKISANKILCELVEFDERRDSYFRQKHHTPTVEREKKQSITAKIGMLGEAFKNMKDKMK